MLIIFVGKRVSNFVYNECVTDKIESVIEWFFDNPDGKYIEIWCNEKKLGMVGFLFKKLPSSNDELKMIIEKTIANSSEEGKIENEICTSETTSQS